MASGIRLCSFLGLFILLSYPTFCQQCNCGSEFSFLKSYIERNYPGFNDKTPEYSGLNYKKYTEEYEAKTAGEKNMTYCMMFMKEWLRYFKDNHLQVVNNPLIGNDSDILSERIRNAEIINIPPDSIKKIKHSSGVEGIYYEYDSLYKVAVIKSPNTWRTYAAVVIESRQPNWKPGMVKFELKEKTDSTLVGKKWQANYPSIFHMANHGIYTNKIMTFSGYGLDGGAWKKEGLKESAAEQKERNKRVSDRKNNPKKSWSYTEFSTPGKDCAYVRISNFDGKIEDEIYSFLQSNDSALSRLPYMILDLRGNSGGSDRSFVSLLPYIYTNPIVTIGVASYATRDNIEAQKAVTAGVEDEATKRWMAQETAEMEGNFGHYTTVVNDTFRMDSVKKNPQKIAILTDGNCAGATEQFLLAAQQSTKVVIMGATTDGTLDYSNKRRKKFPCMPYSLDYPITRSGRLPQHPVDNVGIKPAVALSKDADWVKEAMKYLGAHTK